MGMIDRILTRSGGIAAVTEAAGNMAEIFTPSATRRMELDEAAYAHAITQAQAEFAQAPATWWDSLMNGLNRLPRPLLTLGTIGLFGYSMVAPAGFAARMQGLALVPEPLWWLMGAIVSFYFGAREAHYFRSREWTRLRPRPPGGDGDAEAWRAPRIPAEGNAPGGVVPAADAAQDDFADNAALHEWARTARG